MRKHRENTCRAGGALGERALSPIWQGGLAEASEIVFAKLKPDILEVNK